GTKRAGGRAERSSAGRWSSDAATWGRGPHHGGGAGKNAAAPVPRGARGMEGSTAPASARHGQRMPACVRSCHGGGGPPAWVDAEGACAISLRETRGMCAKEDRRDGGEEEERS